MPNWYNYSYCKKCDRPSSREDNAGAYDIIRATNMTMELDTTVYFVMKLIWGAQVF